MLPYFILLSLPSLLALSKTEHGGRGTYFFVFTSYVFFVGLRYHIGADWSGYLNIHDGLAGEPLVSVFEQSEPLSYLLFWFSENSGYEMLLSNIGAAAILMTGVLAFARRTVNPWLAVVAATPYLIIAFGMSGISQAMGVGVFLLGLSQWEKSSMVRRSVGIVIAALFHTSTLFGGLFVIYDLKLRPFLKIIIGTLFAMLGFFLVQRSETFYQGLAVYQQRYFTADSGQASSVGSMFHIGLILLPAIVGVMYRKRLAPFVHNRSLLALGIVFSLALLPLNSISTTVASRLTLLMYFVPMMVYPALSEAFGPQNRSSMTLAIVLAHFVILAAWLLFANHSMMHIPYRNVVFGTL